MTFSLCATPLHTHTLVFLTYTYTIFNGSVCPYHPLVCQYLCSELGGCGYRVPTLPTMVPDDAFPASAR